MWPAGRTLCTTAIHSSIPDYITDFGISAADNRLRSSARNPLQVPRSSTRFGDCSFSGAGPTAWNSLPDYVKNSSSLETFKSRLKTHLFNHSYGYHDNSSTDISSTTLRLQTFRLQTFRLL